MVRKRFALQGHQKQTLEKIGKHFNVTRERIRQIESIALGKLKRTVRTTKLDEVNDVAKEEKATPARIRFVVGTVLPIRARE